MADFFIHSQKVASPHSFVLIDTVTQHDFVLTGSVRVWTLERITGETVKTIYTANEYIAIPPFTPHIFEFLEDTVMAEWWDGPFEAWFYDPYRSIVQQSFSNVIAPNAKQPGRFALLVEQKRGIVNSLFSIMKDRRWWSGILLGISIGYTMGRRR